MSFRVNSGFEEQLCLYEAMQCEVDTSSPLYKQYRLTKITEKYPGNHTHTHSEIIVKHLSTSHYFCCAFLFLNYMFPFCMCACVWAELQKVPREVFAVDPAHSSSSEASYRCRKCRWKMEAECFKLHVSLIWISWWHTQKQNSLLSWWFYFLAQQSTV